MHSSNNRYQKTAERNRPPRVLQTKLPTFSRGVYETIRQLKVREITESLAELQQDCPSRSFTVSEIAQETGIAQSTIDMIEKSGLEKLRRGLDRIFPAGFQEARRIQFA